MENSIYEIEQLIQVMKDLLIERDVLVETLKIENTCCYILAQEISFLTGRSMDEILNHALNEAQALKN